MGDLSQVLSPWKATAVAIAAEFQTVATNLILWISFLSFLLSKHGVDSQPRGPTTHPENHYYTASLKHICMTCDYSFLFLTG